MKCGCAVLLFDGASLGPREYEGCASSGFVIDHGVLLQAAIALVRTGTAVDFDQVVYAESYSVSLMARLLLVDCLEDFGSDNDGRSCGTVVMVDGVRGRVHFWG